LQQDVDAAQIQPGRFAGQPLGNALAVRSELGLLGYSGFRVASDRRPSTAGSWVGGGGIRY
jgi:hypothetical protein